MMRLPICGLVCLLLASCASPEPALRQPPPAAPVAATGPAVIASTMEIRIDASAVGNPPLDGVNLQDALANVTITEFQSGYGVAVSPVLGSHVEGSRIITHYAPNAYRQTVHIDGHGATHFAHSDVSPGWYTLYSYGSTAGFDVTQPRKGQRSCLAAGLKLAPGVRLVDLKPGDVGYFGHFVIVIAVLPGKGGAPAFELEVTDSFIEPGPANLNELLSAKGLDASRARRIPANGFPCPWSVPRAGSS
jgi:hypothetical protein